MLGRRIDCHHFQGDIANVKKLMLGTCRNDDDIALLDLLLLSSNDSLSLSVCEDERLVDSVNLKVISFHRAIKGLNAKTNLISDLSVHWYFHSNKLGVQACM